MQTALEDDLENRKSQKGELLHMALGKAGTLTHENLNKRKPTQRSSFYLCEEQVETVNHLF